MQEASLSDEIWPSLCEVAEVSSPTASINTKKPQMKPVPTTAAVINNAQSNSDSGDDDSAKENKENKENTSSNEEGQRTPKKKGLSTLFLR